MLRKWGVAFIALVPFNISSAYAGDLVLKSNAVSEGVKLNTRHVFNGFGCKGENIAPQLSWSGAPEGAKSFALTVYDPDAPTGSGWWHWFVFNIPAHISKIPEGGALPDGAVVLRNDYGKVGFGGACPPPDEVHRYQFTIHALDKILDLDPSVSNALAGFNVRANSIASDTITAIYYR